MKKILIILITISVCFSCSKKYKVYKHLQGIWLVEKIYYNNRDMSLEYVNNGISFEGDNIVVLPIRLFYKENGEIDWDLMDKQKNNGEITWDLIQKDTLFFIKFYTNDDVFKDTLQIKFYEEDGFYVMELISVHTYIKSSKWGAYKIK